MTLKNAKAFTLAEVLITLGIIGVVAALTIPTLLAKFQMEQYRSQLKKEYSVLSSAYNTLLQTNGSISASTYIAEMSTQISIIKSGIWRNVTNLPSPFSYKCYKESSGTCNNTVNRPVYDGCPAFIQKDGIEVILMNLQPNCDGGNWSAKIDAAETFPQYNLCEQIAVDLNGDKGPNSIGMDLHVFMLLKKNNNYYFRPIGANVTTNCLKGYPDTNSNSLYCTNRMLLNMDMP